MNTKNSFLSDCVEILEWGGISKENLFCKCGEFGMDSTAKASRFCEMEYPFCERKSFFLKPVLRNKLSKRDFLLILGENSIPLEV